MKELKRVGQSYAAAVEGTKDHQHGPPHLWMWESLMKSLAADPKAREKKSERRMGGQVRRAVLRPRHAPPSGGLQGLSDQEDQGQIQEQAAPIDTASSIPRQSDRDVEAGGERRA